MALTQISTDGIKNGTITGSDLATNVDLVDNQKLRLGTGNDLELYHNGSSSFLDNGTGDLYLRNSASSGQMLLRADGNILISNYAANEYRIKTFNNGAVELYHDNIKTAFTDVDQWKVYGRTANSGMVEIASNQGANNNDRFRVHKTSASSTLSIQNYTSGSWENNLKAIGNGAVELYYDNTKRFETTSSGITVAGNGVFTGNVQVNDNNFINIGNSGDLQLSHDGTNNFIDFGSGELRIRAMSGDDDNCIIVKNDGAVELYHDNTKRFETASYGVSTDGLMNFNGTGDKILIADEGKIAFGGGGDLKIYHDGSHSYIYESGQGKLRLLTNSFRLLETDNSTAMIAADENGAVYLYNNGTLRLETTSGGGSLTGDWNVSNDFFWFDNGQAVFGSGGDLKIYHDGTNNKIAGFTASDINIESYFNSDVNIITNSNHFAIKCISNAQVELYYDNSKKFETLSDGIKVTGAIEAAGVPLQQVFSSSSTSLTKTGTGTVALGFSSMSMTTKRSNSLIVFSYTISGEIDGNRGQCFYRLFYSTSSNYSGEQAVNSACFQGNSHAVSDGDFSDSGTFHFTNPVSAGTTIYLRMKYSNSNSGASIEFNQQSLTNQPSGTSNISFFRLEELTT